MDFSIFEYYQNRKHKYYLIVRFSWNAPHVITGKLITHELKTYKYFKQKKK